MENAKNWITLIIMLAGLATLHSGGLAAAQGIEGKVVSNGVGTPATPPNSGEVRITAQIFRIRGNISGDTSLTDDIWAGKKPRGDEEKNAISFFNTAKLSVAGHRLNVDEKGWRCDEREIPLAGSAIPSPGGALQLLAGPRLMAQYGQVSTINLSSEQAIEYFVQKTGNLYQLKKSLEPTGLSLSASVDPDPNGRLHVRDMRLTLRLVESRKPLEGTTLNVGEPVINSRELKADIHLKPAKDYGFFFFAGDGQGTLLVRLRVEPAAAGKPKGKK